MKFELTYKNGAASPKPPVYSDVYLSRDSQAQCELILEEGRKFDRVIQNEKQLQACIDVHSEVDETIRQVKQCAAEQRQPYVRVQSQIGAATEPMLAELGALSHALRSRVTDWRQKVLEGQEREEQRLRDLAREKEQEAKYSDNPTKKRAAAVAAKQYAKAAEDAAPKPEKGLGTETYWEVEITNRVQAAKLPEEAVEMIPNEVWFNREIKRRQNAGEKIHSNSFPGITLKQKTRVKFYR